MRRFRQLPLVLLIVCSFGAAALTACTSVDEVADRVEQEAEERTDRAVDRAVEGTADKTEETVANAVKCAVGDDECVREARREGKDVVMTDEDGEVLRDEEDTPITDPEAAAAQAGNTSAAAPGEGVWANYDFVSGKRVLFYDDYTGDRVGDFPRNLEFVKGSLGVIEWEGRRAIRAQSTGAFDVELGETLPERFTLEFDFYTPDFVNGIWVRPVEDDGTPVGMHYLQVDPGNGTGIDADDRGGSESLESARDAITSEMTPIRLMADGSYVKVYAGTERVANIPNAELDRSSTLRFILEDVRDEPVYIGPIRVAAGGRDLYAALEAEGRVATRGIQFDTGSAALRPGSTPTLEEMVQMLKQYPDLRIRIEGHTDATGSKATNQSLSQQRAEAVEQYLVEKHSIDASRLEAVGKGESAPVASNDTPEGRQTNRRVELVRL